MKFTKKLFVAILTMALLVVTFGTSTFAWFTLSQTSEIQNLHVHVQTGIGMEVSKDGNVWKNNLDLSEEADIRFADLASTDGIAIKDMYGNAATANKDYLLTEFYVRITKDEDGNSPYDVIYLYEVTGSHDPATQSTEWTADVTFGNSTDNFIQGSKYEWDALGALRLSATKSGSDSAHFVYEYEATDDRGGADDSDESLVKKYAAAKGFEIDDNAPAALTTTIKDADLNESDAIVLEAADFDITSITGVTSLDERYLYAKVTVRIWLDGWDADCINAILSQVATISFKLKAHKAN